MTEKEATVLMHKVYGACEKAGLNPGETQFGAMAVIVLFIDKQDAAARDALRPVRTALSEILMSAEEVPVVRA